MSLRHANPEITHMSAHEKPTADQRPQSDHIQRRREQQLRRLLRREYGASKYRLTADDKVLAYGRKPHTIVCGWWVVGSRPDVERRYGL